jgi:long-chain acyl-CoA synthetase
MTHPRIFAGRSPSHIVYSLAGSGASLTYAQLEESANRLARVFRENDLGPGDHVAFMVENTLSFMVLCWAAQRSGLYYTPISTHLVPREIDYIRNDCDAGMFIISAAYADKAEALLTFPFAGKLFSVGGEIAGYRSLEDAAGGKKSDPIPDEVAGYDMLYSSGTTGRPKGVCTPFNWDPVLDLPKSALTDLFLTRFGFDQSTLFLSPAPLYHGAPGRACMAAARAGGRSIIMERFDAEELLRLIENHRVTHVQLVPTMFVRLLRLPEDIRCKYDLASLRAVIHGAGPCAPHVKQQMIEWLGPIIHEFYGGTEGNGIVAIDSPEWLAHPGSVGRAMTGELKILDDNGVELPPGRDGLIYFAHGRQFVYYKDPEKTAAAYNDRGWSSLGDIGHLDEEGYLYLVDRKAFTIISGGVNIYPQEIENLLLEHPAVLDVAVIGIPNEEFGQEVKAFVQLMPGTVEQEAAGELQGFCRAGLSALKCPRSFAFVSQLPRDPAGKIRKSDLQIFRDREST